MDLPKKRLFDLSSDSKDPSLFQSLKHENSKRRNLARLCKIWKEKCFWHHLEQINCPLDDDDNENIYYFDDINTNNVNIPEPPCDWEDFQPYLISEMDIIDNCDKTYEDKNIIITTTDPITNKKRIVAILLNKESRGKISLVRWKKHLVALRNLFKTHPNNPRGLRRLGAFGNYVLFGWRRDANSPNVKKYVPKKSAKEQLVKLVDCGLKDLMHDLEMNGLNIIPDYDLSVQNMLREDDEMGDVFVNGMEGRFSQMAAATNYWSPLHIDDDLFWTLLTCCGESKLVWNKESRKMGVSNDIICYFVFPSIGEKGIAIAMRATDMLVFDSKFPHCASNILSEDAILLSCFTASKTSNAHLAKKQKQVKEETEALVEMLQN